MSMFGLTHPPLPGFGHPDLDNLANPIWANPFWDLGVCHGGPPKGGPNQEKWGPEGWGPEGWEAQNFALFFPSPATISLFLCLSGCLLVECW